MSLAADCNYLSFVLIDWVFKGYLCVVFMNETAEPAPAPLDEILVPPG
jgi:hypothetical protein